MDRSGMPISSGLCFTRKDRRRGLGEYQRSHNCVALGRGSKSRGEFAAAASERSGPRYDLVRMGRLGNISGKNAVKAFEKTGWQRIGQVGSHVVLSKPNIRVNLSVPQHKELAAGTLQALIRNAGLSVDEFIKLTK